MATGIPPDFDPPGWGRANGRPVRVADGGPDQDHAGNANEIPDPKGHADKDPNADRHANPDPDGHARGANGDSRATHTDPNPNARWGANTHTDFHAPTRRPTYTLPPANHPPEHPAGHGVHASRWRVVLGREWQAARVRATGAAGGRDHPVLDLRAGERLGSMKEK